MAVFGTFLSGIGRPDTQQLNRLDLCQPYKTKRGTKNEDYLKHNKGDRSNSMGVSGITYL